MSDITEGSVASESMLTCSRGETDNSIDEAACVVASWSTLCQRKGRHPNHI